MLAGSRPDTGQVTDAPTADAGLRGDASSDLLTVTSPANGATVAGTVIFKGQAGSQWVNIAAYDETNGGAKVSSDTTPSNGAFAISVETTQLAPGMASFAITGFSVPPGQLGGTSRSVSLSLNIDTDVGTGQGLAPDPGCMLPDDLPVRSQQFGDRSAAGRVPDRCVHPTPRVAAYGGWSRVMVQLAGRTGPDG